MYVCVQNTAFCQSAGEGIKSHSVTALVILHFEKDKSFSHNAVFLPQYLYMCVNISCNHFVRDAHLLAAKKSTLSHYVFTSKYCDVSHSKAYQSRLMYVMYYGPMA